MQRMRARGCTACWSGKSGSGRREIGIWARGLVAGARCLTDARDMLVWGYSNGIIDFALRQSDGNGTSCKTSAENGWLLSLLSRRLRVEYMVFNK